MHSSEVNGKAVFSGIYPAIVTPVDSTGQLMEDSVRQLVRRLATTPVDGLYVGGGTGEGILLPVSVRKRLLEVVIDARRGLKRCSPLRVIAHVGAAEAANTAELVRHAAHVGVEAVSAIPPIYYTYGRERICAYYGWLASLSEVPLIIYAAAQAGVSFTAEMLKECVTYPTIKGLKFTSSNFYEMMRMRAAVPEGFTILNGADEQLAFGLLAGADGGIGTTYNVMPQTFCKLYQAWCRRDMDEVRRLQEMVNSVITVIIRYPVIAAVKVMLDASGIPMGPPVFPNDEFPQEKRQEFLTSLAQAGWPESVS